MPRLRAAADRLPRHSLTICSIADLLPPEALNVVNGLDRDAEMPLVTSKRVAKIALSKLTN